MGDRLKDKGDEVAALTETGIAATLGVIFNAPLFGIAGNLEPDNRKEKYRTKLVSKKSRIILYVMGVLGGMAGNAAAGYDIRQGRRSAEVRCRVQLRNRAVEMVPGTGDSRGDLRSVLSYGE